jgi:ABC-type polar amino acid transport system ATPase subunit
VDITAKGTAASDQIGVALLRSDIPDYRDRMVDLSAAPPPLHTGDALVSLRGVDKYFGSLHVLQNIDLTVTRGEVVVIIGPSGSGKSTMLRCMNMLERPTSGSVVLLGHELTRRGAKLTEVRRSVGMVFQQFNLFPHMTVLANVMEGPRVVMRVGKAEARERALALLEKVGVREHAHKKPHQLSGGQQQRVAIARALALDPKVMLFDEPTSALDPELRAEVLDVMLQLAADGMTMIIVTHEMNFARKVADRAIFIDDGVIVEQGEPAVMLQRPKTERLDRFLGMIFWGDREVEPVGDEAG